MRNKEAEFQKQLKEEARETNNRLADLNIELAETLDLILGSMVLERTERFDLLERAKKALNNYKNNTP